MTKLCAILKKHTPIVIINSEIHPLNFLCILRNAETSVVEDDKDSKHWLSLETYMLPKKVDNLDKSYFCLFQ